MGGLPVGRNRKPRDENGKRGQTMHCGEHPRRPTEKEKVAQPVLGESFNIGWLASTEAQCLFQPGQGANHAEPGFPSDKRDQAQMREPEPRIAHPLNLEGTPNHDEQQSTDDKRCQAEMGSECDVGGKPPRPNCEKIQDEKPPYIPTGQQAFMGELRPILSNVSNRVNNGREPWRGGHTCAGSTNDNRPRLSFNLGPEFP